MKIEDLRPCKYGSTRNAHIPGYITFYTKGYFHEYVILFKHCYALIESEKGILLKINLEMHNIIFLDRNYAPPPSDIKDNPADHG